MVSALDRSAFADLYPWQSRWFDRDGLQMHYLDEGRGDALVMLHGNPTWSFYWRHLVAGLCDTHRTVVPDHIGMGLSDKPGDDRYTYTLASRVADLDALLRHLDIRQNVTLIGHDWGGMIGLAWAMGHPGRVQRLVLMNTAGFLLPKGLSLPWRLKVVRHLPASIPVRGLNGFVRGAAALCSTRPGRMTPQIRAAYMAPYDSWQNRIAILRFVEDIPLRPTDPAYPLVKEVDDALERIAELPLQIFWGERDFVFDVNLLAEWRRRVPTAEYHTFPDCGHYVLEDAHEEILPRIRDFLARHPLETP